jgi:hypothetical protein
MLQEHSDHDDFENSRRKKIMKFPMVEIKSIRADIGAGKIKLAFEAKLNEETLGLAQALAAGADVNNGLASLEVELAQPGLPGLSVLNRENEIFTTTGTADTTEDDDG